MDNRDNKKNYGVYGWEIFWHQAKMRLGMLAKIGVLFSVAQFLVFTLLLWFFMSGREFDITWRYLVSIVTAPMINPEFHIPGIPTSVSARQLLSSTVVHKIVGYVYGRVVVAAIFSVSIWLLCPIALRNMYRRGEKALSTEHIRGMQLVESSQVQNEVAGKPSTFTFGDVSLPTELEPEQILLAGKTRVGKTVCTIQAIDALRRTGAKAVIHDFRGELTARFFDPEKDFILNPLDARSSGWNIFSDITTRADLTSLWDSLIPPSTGEDKFFCAAAGNVGKGICAGLWVEGKKTNRDLWEAITGSQDRIEELLKLAPTGAAGYKAIAEEARGKQSAGVLAVLLQYTAWLEYAVDGGSFSINKWLAQKGGGFIFLTGKAEVKETIKPLTGLFIEMLGKKILDLPEDPIRRIYFMLDELNNLQRLPTLPDLLTSAGAKGAIFWLAIQDFARLVKVYGKENAEAVMNSCGTWLTLKLKDSATSKVFSEALGQYQYWDVQHNYSMSANDNRDGETVSRNRRTDWLVLPSEIMSLKKLEGYLAIPEHMPCKIRISVAASNMRKPAQADFVLKEGWLLDDLRERQDARISEIELLTGINRKQLALTDTDDAKTIAERELDSDDDNQLAEQTSKKVSLDLF